MKLDRPTIPEVLPLAQAYYAKPENCVGGNLHLVLEEGNVQDDHVRYCLERARGAGDEDGVMLAGMLLKMTKTQRPKLEALL